MLLKTQGKTNLQIQKLLSFKRKGTDNHCGEPTTRALRVLENNKPYRPIKSLQKNLCRHPYGAQRRGPAHAQLRRPLSSAVHPLVGAGEPFLPHLQHVADHSSWS